jgi:hypothetical protein
MAGRHEARRAVEGRAEVVAVARLGLAQVDVHPHAQVAEALAERAPILRRQRPLRVRRRHQGRVGVLERGVEGVAHRLEHQAAAFLDRRAQQRVVPRQGGGHGRAALLPARRRALDVREQEGQGAAGEGGGGVHGTGERTRLVMARPWKVGDGDLAAASSMA